MLAVDVRTARLGGTGGPAANRGPETDFGRVHPIRRGAPRPLEAPMARHAESEQTWIA